MDSYEVESIAQIAAERAAGDVRRELSYRIDDLERIVDRLRNELDDERTARKGADAHLSDCLATVGG